ncbi:hypothetical protein AB0383_20720 [Amycolatopsis sp. NPDC051373]|uniref:hypothetical protein n=1 Tax=Amycolatopsis sp. NPDC051373 TaxID=3155801 RepID=UPI00344CB71A
MTTTHRTSRQTPEEDRAHRYAATEKTGWFHPTCVHGTTAYEGEMPTCGTRPCLTRWWVRYGIPSLSLVVGFIVYCCIAFHVPDCPDGWRSLGLGTCVRN